LPLVMGTTRPPKEEFPPTATQEDEVGQDTPVRNAVPETVDGLPALPLVMGTTTPTKEEFCPTATQNFDVGQATPNRSAVPGTVETVEELADASWPNVSKEKSPIPPNAATRRFHLPGGRPGSIRFASIRALSLTISSPLIPAS
jgi:hypothetical protein